MNTADVPDRLFLDYRLDNGVAVVKVTGEVGFLDSTGVGVLVGIWHRVCATPGCLALAAPSRQVRGVLETTGLTQVLPIYDTEAAAVQACREPTTR